VGFAEALAHGDRVARGQLGRAVTYTPAVGVPVTVTGIFDEAYQLVDLQQAGVSSSSPAVFLTLADLPSDPELDTAATVTVGARVFKPWKVMPDGQGGVLLLMHLF
jgi:hypothetical protein